MNLTTLPKIVLRLQYKIARFPLGLVEQQLRFLPTDAPPRLMYERGLGMLDGIVGSVLDDQEIATRGALATERADAVKRAEKLDAHAAAEKRAADAELRRAHERAAAEQEAAQKKAAEPAKVSLKDAVAKQLEVKEAQERAHDEGEVAEFEKIEHKNP
ncbi:IF2 family translation initiation factor [Rhodococcus zopfii]|uniref:IF2 family translation initiation factor n=1 Tax=Rhodococcus zopfii TaxID=43772 RepID=A0ABU3WMZ5_9NOCA|nr:IF2 family translation initiation factor [Rhodococcus zopfii]